jgi:phosphatidylinositol alpha-mannosyltransferase
VTIESTGSKLRIGIVCPYSWDVPGGVQTHIRDLTHALQSRGHEVSVLAPGDEETADDFVVSAGRAIPVRYNGSVARLAFGPFSGQRVRKWIDEGNFDVVHVHEPAAPSISLVTCLVSEGALVGTFHTSNARSRMMAVSAGFLKVALEKLSARITVSAPAHVTLGDHSELFGASTVTIPNGVDVSEYADAEPMAIEPADAQVVVFLGRIDEPRKGFQVLAPALATIAGQCPKARFFIAGPGDADQATKLIPKSVRSRVHFLGRISEAEKASLMARADVFVAPNTGGESFGIILLEAMAAGAAVVASDLEAFSLVLGADPVGKMFANEDSAALAHAVIEVLRDDVLRQDFVTRGKDQAYKYDWNVLVDEVIGVYESVHVPGQVVREDAAGTAFGRAKVWGKGDRE